MDTRLGDGLWAFGRAGEVHIGLLDGDMRRGWRPSFASLPGRVLPAVIRRLNTGGLWTNGRVEIAVQAGRSHLLLPDGLRADLDTDATARLQVFCSHVRAGRDRAAPGEGTPLAVATSRGGLLVRQDRWPGMPTGQAHVTAAAGAVVRADVPTVAGPTTLSLPALPVLVAAAEAGQDDTTLAVEVLVGEERVAVAVDAHDAEQAAAEAQWLLPSLTRRVGQAPSA